MHAEVAAFLAAVASQAGGAVSAHEITALTMRLFEAIKRRVEGKQVQRGRRIREWLGGPTIATEESAALLLQTNPGALVQRAAAAGRTWAGQVFTEGLNAVDALETWRLTGTDPANLAEVQDERGLRALDRIAREVSGGPEALQDLRRNAVQRLSTLTDRTMASALADVVFFRFSSADVALAHGYRPGGFNRVLNSGKPRWDARVRTFVADRRLLSWGARHAGGALLRALRTLFRPTEDELTAIGADGYVEFFSREEVDARSGAWTPGSWLRLAEQLGLAQPSAYPRANPDLVRSIVEPNVRDVVRRVLARR